MAECITILKDPVSKDTIICDDEKYFYQSFNSIFVDLMELPTTDKIMDFFYDFVGSFITYNHNKLRYQKNYITKNEYEKIKEEYDMLLEEQENYFNGELIEDGELKEGFIESIMNQPKELSLEFETSEELEKFIFGEKE